MALEAMAAQETMKAAQEATRLVDQSVRKAWSILDAAAEKQRPSEVLSQQAIRAIQGGAPPGE
jgi:hypothetical protein